MSFLRRPPIAAWSSRIRQLGDGSTMGARPRLASSAAADPAAAASTAAAAAAPTPTPLPQQQPQPHRMLAPERSPTYVGRERIGADGRLRLAVQPRHAQQQQQQQQQHTGTARRPPGLAPAAPVAPPIADDQLERLVDLIASARRVVVITGAGVSTESNIPDYRGPGGAYTTGFTPMTHSQFLQSEAARRRYWHRSFCGWHEFASARPNAAHEGLARLQAAGWVSDVITQNVDRLHHSAGSPPSRVLELHGTTHRVQCMGACGAESCRRELQAKLAELNPEAAALVARIMAASDEPGRWRRALSAGTAADARATTTTTGSSPDATAADAGAPASTTSAAVAERVPVRRPDGDVELVDAGAGFSVPPCDGCGGFLKPAVTFFGDSVRPAVAARSLELAGGCDLLLAVGTSLMVWSAFRLAKTAKESGAKLALVCVGETRADSLADFKAEALAGEVLARLAAHPRLLLPRVA